MSRGGKREGSGRPKGAASAVTVRRREAAERALADGKSPLEVIIDNMRHFQQLALDAEATLANLNSEDFVGPDVDPKEQFKALLAEVKKAAGLRQLATDCARDAAPYLHPRLQAIEHTGADGGPIVMRATKEQRDAAVSAALRSSVDT